MLLEEPKFNTLSEAIEEAHKWVKEADLPVIITLEEDGSYTFYGHGKRVYNTVGLLADSELDIYQQN